ncbi:MAG: 4-hydroxy-tetrahydrodipicolinate synthase [Marinilabiliales bacterium]
MKKGVYTLLITPFKQDYTLDEEGLRILVRRQVEAGVDGIAPLGVTGENTLMDDNEIKRVVEIIVEEAKGKVKVLPDVCEERLDKSLDRVKLYCDLGVDYVVAYTPYLILPRPAGLIDYYEKLADTSSVPVILHSSKSRTGVELTPEMTAKLAKHPNIIATKDGNKQLDHLAKLIYLTRNDDFLVFTGKDTTAFPTVAFGGAGTFSVSANVVPDVMAKMIHLALERKFDEALQLHYEYYELFEAMRFESNPMAAKKALNMMNLPGGPLRPPLTELSNEKSLIVQKLLKEKGLI